MTLCRVRRVSFLGDKFDDTVSGEKGIILWRQV